MKYLKEWKIFENHDNIYEICRKYGITNYTINSDGTIDVDGDVDLSDKGLTKLPLTFNRVIGDFSCSYNNRLTSLEGSPKHIDGYFSCSYNNRLTSLEGSPKHIDGYFSCYSNKLINLDHLPEVSGDIYMVNNPVYWIVKDWIKSPKGRWEKWEYFQDLNIIQGSKVILERLEEFHEVMEIPMPDLKEIKKYYIVIE